jgi:acyl-coenzyme A thioesterase PaaI-like protein
MTDQAPDPRSEPHAFSAASALRPTAAGGFAAEVSGAWTIGGRPSGGYLLALLARAATALTGTVHVAAASAHYLRSPDPGPVEIAGEVLRRGRSISQVRVRMSQGGRPCVEALMSTGVLEAATTPRWDGGARDTPPPAFDDGIRLPPLTPDGIPVEMLNHVDLRVDRESSGMIDRRPSGRGRLTGWLALLGEDFDPISLLYAIDAFPPATWDTDAGCWMSTIEMTAYVRAVPAPGPLRVVSRTRLVDPPWVDQTCEIRDGTGRLVAQASQLAKVLG